MLTKYTTNERKKEQSAKIIFVIIMCDHQDQHQFEGKRKTI